MGTIGILNVGAGDTKLTFDKDNPAECIQSGRIVTDMLRRGYALLIEVPDKKGKKTYARVKEFRADVNEYIIADFDPIEAAQADRVENDQSSNAAPGGEAEEEVGEVKRPRIGRPAKGRTRSIPATGVSGIAVSRSAGG